VFEVAVSQRPGAVSERHRFSRGQLSRYLAEQAPATVVMEACGTARSWGREASARGQQVVLIPPHAVRPYVLRNKTDGADAKGLLEALRNDDVRPVPVKSVDQHVRTCSRHCTACARPGWRPVGRGSTPCAVCCASSGT
jgi:transposase